MNSIYDKIELDWLKGLVSKPPSRGYMHECPNAVVVVRGNSAIKFSSSISRLALICATIICTVLTGFCCFFTYVVVDFHCVACFTVVVILHMIINAVKGPQPTTKHISGETDDDFEIQEDDEAKAGKFNVLESKKTNPARKVKSVQQMTSGSLKYVNEKSRGVPPQFLYFLFSCFTIICLFVVYQLFHDKTLTAIVSVVVIFLVVKYGVQYYAVKATADTEISANQNELIKRKHEIDGQVKAIQSQTDVKAMEYSAQVSIASLDHERQMKTIEVSSENVLQHLKDN